MIMTEGPSPGGVGNATMKIGTHRITCAEDCPDRIRLTVGSATHVARKHVEETGHACVVSPLDGDDRTPVDERKWSAFTISAADESHRDEGESPGRSRTPTAPPARNAGPE